MSDLDKLQAAEAAAIAGIVSDATTPLQQQLNAANAALTAAQQNDSSDQATIANLSKQLSDAQTAANSAEAADQAKIDQLSQQVADLHAQIAALQPPAVQPDPGLPFKLDHAALKKSPKMLFAHYFPPYPTSFENADPSTDYYTRNYLNMNGESGSHLTYGGLLRNRPMGRKPLSGDWAEADRRQEIQDAYDAGINGWVVDLLSPSGPNWTRALAVAASADAMFPDGSFKVIPMFDTTASFGKETSQQVADALVAFANRPSAYVLPDGRWVVSSFKPEQLGAAWWDATFAAIKASHNLSCAFLGAYLDINQAANFAGHPWTYGSGDWGDGADPGIAIGASDKSVAVKARGEIWMQPLQPQNVRPNAGCFDDAQGTASYREWFLRAIRCDADAAQIVTQTDWSESGAIANSVLCGKVPLDLTAYYVTKWKTGSFPTILADAIYLSHRSHFANATFQSQKLGQTRIMTHWKRGTGETPNPVDIVECLTMLTAPASVTVTIGTTQHTYDAPAGLNAQTFPLAVGTVSAVATRSGSEVAKLTSPVQVSATPFKDVFVYVESGSIRGTQGQYDCNTA